MKQSKTLVRTYENEMYIIPGKSPKEVLKSIENLDFIEMPNGSVVSKKSISLIQTYEDYKFQTDQKSRHKKGQFLGNGNWNDDKGMVAIANLHMITGEKPDDGLLSDPKIVKPYNDQ